MNPPQLPALPPGAAASAEIFLQPGELWFGASPACVRTLLGSCVAITLWHPQRKVGGMCHYLLPAPPTVRRGDDREPQSVADGRYAEGAINWFLECLRDLGAPAKEFQVKMFGGGAQFTTSRGRIDGGIPDSNVAAGHTLLARHGFVLSAEQIGGCGRRHVIFQLATGDVWIRHVATLMQEEV